MATFANGQVSIAEIVLYSFLEFTHDVYGRDVIKEVLSTDKDVYGRNMARACPKLAAFYSAFPARPSAKGVAAAGEEVPQAIAAKGDVWAEGSM